MAKPDPALLDPAHYPFYCEIGTRYADLDPNHHINNVALSAMLEEARAQFHRASSFHDRMTGMTIMIVSVAIEYLGQAWYPQPLEIHAAIVHIGRTSYVMRQLIRQDERSVAFAEIVCVCVADDRPTAIPAAVVTGLADWGLRP